MHKDFDTPNQREATPEEHSRKLEALKRRAETDQAGYGQVGGVAQGVNQIMDKRIIQSALHQRASELRGRAEGLERLAELAGAAATHDFALFSTILSLLDRR